MLLRYSFTKMDDGAYLLSNDAGKFLFVSEDEFMQCATGEITSVPLYINLEKGLFIDNECNREQTYNILRRKITKNGNNGCRTILKITSFCNCECIYCLSDSTHEKMNESMTIETIDKSLDFILNSGKQHLIIELQGGEPLSQFESIKYINEEIHKRKQPWQTVDFVIMSNMTLLTQEMATYFKDNNIALGTSIDGPKDIHDKHRPLYTGEGSFDKQTANVEMYKAIQDKQVGALITLCKDTLDKARDIIDYYIERGERVIFVRPTYNIGRAHRNWDTVGYTGEEFVKYYIDCVEYLIELNQKGVDVFERTTADALCKIFDGASGSIENTSPCGMTYNMISINHDGFVYACEGGRMLGDMGCREFCIGDVYTDTYDQVLRKKHTRDLEERSIIESKPSCSYCVYEPWCGKCPVEEQMETYSANTYLCAINKGTFDYIFKLLKDDVKRPIIMKWFEKSKGAK